MVTRALEKYKFKHQTALKNAQEVTKALNESSIYVNEFNLAHNKRINESLAVYYMPENEKNENRTKMSVTKFHSYYNFQHKWVKVGNEEQFKFLSTVYSDLTHLIRVDYKIEDSRENFIYNVDPKKNVI